MLGLVVCTQPSVPVVVLTEGFLLSQPSIFHDSSLRLYFSPLDTVQGGGSVRLSVETIVPPHQSIHDIRNTFWSSRVKRHSVPHPRRCWRHLTVGPMAMGRMGTWLPMRQHTYDELNLLRFLPPHHNYRLYHPSSLSSPSVV